MSININHSECIGCRKCSAVCPGNIIKADTTGKAYLKRPSDCWNCLACMKECPAGAITLILPPEMDGRGGRLGIKSGEYITEWTVSRADGTAIKIITSTKEANTY